jgi:MFS family permease
MVSPLIIGTGLFILSGIYVGGDYFHNVLPGLLVFAAGMGFTFISITIAATSGVPRNEAGLASGLLSTSQQIGGALGLAVLSSISASRTADFIAANPSLPNVTVIGQVEGYQSAFRVGVVFMIIGALFAATILKSVKGEKQEVVAPSLH